MKLRVFNILKNTKVEGPGNRYCIWVQGCSHHCKGCQAVHTWSHKGGTLLGVNDIIDDIFKQKILKALLFGENLLSEQKHWERLQKLATNPI